MDGLTERVCVRLGRTEWNRGTSSGAGAAAAAAAPPLAGCEAMPTI